MKHLFAVKHLSSRIGLAALLACGITAAFPPATQASTTSPRLMCRNKPTPN